MNKVEEYYLQHAGVKGMKWGVRKSVSGAGNRVKTRVKREVGSYKRERSQLKGKDLSKMTDSELKNALNRNRLENQLKEEYRKTTGIGFNRGEEYDTRRKTNRDAYLDRGKLSDKELQAKVNRIRSENQLAQEANRVNRKTLEAGESFIEGVSTSVFNNLTSGRQYSTGKLITNALISGGFEATKTYVKETRSENNRYNRTYG